MTNMLSRTAQAVLVVLALGAGYNVSSAVAQTAKPKPPVLIYTSCEVGKVNECGEEPTRTECTRSWKVDLGWITQTFGIGISEVKCVSVGGRKLFKDFYEGRSGSCYVTPTNPFDGTRVSPIRDEDGSEDELCE